MLFWRPLLSLAKNKFGASRNFCTQQIMNGSKIFKSKRNCETGQFEWIVADECVADFFQDIARSAYADMLHDDERNKLYYQALRNVISTVKSQNGGAPIHVVDIGTGSGLLSMMAASVGADKVTAIEAFDPVAIVARRIIDLNGFSDKINVISGRSTDLDSDELTEKGDIAVAEVFDTELIGENALKTFSDAQKTLLKPGARIIPSKAKFFAQIVSSDLALNWHRAKPVNLPEFGVDIRVAPVFLSCPGNDTVHDIQMSQFPVDRFSPITDPIQVFEFDFEKPIVFDERKTFHVHLCPVDAKKCSSETADVVFTWWELDMDGTGSLPLSTKPDWSSNSSSVQWRDHWIQSVYFLPQSIHRRPDCPIYFHACHDEYSFWFSVTKQELKKEPDAYKRPRCTCGLHQVLSRTNFARFNDMERYTRLCNVIGDVVSGKSCVSLGDCSLLPLIAAQLGAKDIYVVEAEEANQKILKTYAEFNGLTSSIHFVDSMGRLPENSKFEVVLADPFFASSFLPWHNLHIWRLVDDLKQFGLLADNYQLVPNRAELYALPVEFEHLWKIRAPAGLIEGFDIKPFDDVVQASIGNVDCPVEPQPLWEYPSTALSEPVKLLQFSLTEGSPFEDVHSRKEAVFFEPSKCNGVALWMQWYYGDKLIESTGLLDDLPNGGDNNNRSRIAGLKPKWTMSTKQAVQLFTAPFKLAERMIVESRLDSRNEATFIFS